MFVHFLYIPVYLMSGWATVVLNLSCPPSSTDWLIIYSLLTLAISGNPAGSHGGCCIEHIYEYIKSALQCLCAWTRVTVLKSKTGSSCTAIDCSMHSSQRRWTWKPAYPATNSHSSILNLHVPVQGIAFCTYTCMPTGVIQVTCMPVYKCTCIPRSQQTLMGQILCNQDLCYQLCNYIALSPPLIQLLGILHIKDSINSVIVRHVQTLIGMPQLRLPQLDTKHAVCRVSIANLTCMHSQQYMCDDISSTTTRVPVGIETYFES